MLSLEIHAVRLCMLGTNRHMFPFVLFLYVCGHLALWESLRRKLYIPKELIASHCPFCSAGAVNYIFISVAHLPFLTELNAAIPAAFCSAVYLVASRLGLSPILNSSVDQTCLNNYSNYVANNR